MSERKWTPDARDYGMITVSREAFFATVGSRNVTPAATGAYDNALGYLSRWKTPHGDILGATVGGTHLTHTAYMVTPAFYEANRAALSRAIGQE